MDGNRISLKVATEVSELDFAREPATMPSLNTRRAETTVDLASGQSFAIAGLMQNRSSQSTARMPGARHRPGARRAVPLEQLQARPDRARHHRDAGRGQPDHRRGVATPVDQFVPPNDFERILLGRFQGDRGRRARCRTASASRRLIGQSGFVFE